MSASLFDNEIATLSRATLDWLWGQVYEPADKGLKSAIRRAYFAKHSVTLHEWPAYEADPRDHAWAAELGASHLVRYCPKATGHRDVLHQPEAAAYIGSGADRPEVAPYIRCMCGRVSHLFDLPLEQRCPTPRVWPLEDGPGRHANGSVVKQYVVCSQATSAFDVKHAPRGFEWDPRCICGWTLDPERLADRDLKLKRFDAQ